MNTSRVFALILSVAFGWLAALLFFKAPPAASLGFVALLPAANAASNLWRNPEQTRAILPAQVQTLLSFVLFALGTGAGLLLGQ